MLSVSVHPRQVIRFETFVTFPAPAVALDGYVFGPPRWSPAGPHASFNHHEGVDRIATRATCEQVALAVRMGLNEKLTARGAPSVVVHVNDSDPDVALSVWLLANPHRVYERAVDRLVRAEGILDTTAGAYPPEPEGDPFLEEMNWVFEPYHDNRDSVVLTGGEKELGELLAELGRRITAHVDGHGGSVAAKCNFEVIDRRGPVSAVVEHCPLARASMRRAGIETYVAVRRSGDLTAISIGKMSKFVPIDLRAVYTRLNALEGCNGSDSWGGSDTVGGSPRAAGTHLDIETILDVVTSCSNSS